MSKENTESQKRVKELLLQGLSRSDIATAAKVTPQYVSAIRKKLEKQLKMPLDRYLAQKGAAPTPSKIAAAPTEIKAKEEVLDFSFPVLGSFIRHLSKRFTTLTGRVKLV